MSVKFVRDVPVKDFMEQAGKALVEHWLELAGNKDKIILKPDFERYSLLQKSGVLKNIVVYDENGDLVGYSVLFVQPHIHYMDDIFAYVDVIFVKGEKRYSTIGIRLINETEAYCNELGVSVITYHTKPSHPAIEKVLQRKGYSHYENILGKCLKGDSNGNK